MDFALAISAQATTQRVMPAQVQASTSCPRTRASMDLVLVIPAQAGIQ